MGFVGGKKTKLKKLSEQTIKQVSFTQSFSDWSSIDWKKAKRGVQRLQERIFRATTNHDWKKVRIL
jgi:hypothetical protein